MGKDHAISKANQIPVSEKRSVRVHPFISEAVFDMSFERFCLALRFFSPFLRLRMHDRIVYIRMLYINVLLGLPRTSTGLMYGVASLCWDLLHSRSQRLVISLVSLVTPLYYYAL